MVQPTRATASMIANARVKAVGSMPPSSEQIDRTGQVQATNPRIGNSRAPSLPRTISGSERSVARIWVRVPRARSPQIAPAVAAGAASITSVSSTPMIA